MKRFGLTNRYIKRNRISRRGIGLFKGEWRRVDMLWAAYRHHAGQALYFWYTRQIAASHKMLAKRAPWEG